MKLEPLQWLGAVLALLAIGLVLTPMSAGDVRVLDGDLSAFSDGQAVTVELPGSFLVEGSQSDLVRVSLGNIGHDVRPQAVYIQGVDYAARVTLDGTDIGGVGDIRDGGERRRGNVFVPLPAISPGESLALEVTFRGAHGRGAISGHLYLGPSAQVMRLMQQYDGQRVGAVLAFALLAMAQLITSQVRRQRLKIWTGTWAALAALLVLSGSGWGGPLSIAHVAIRLEAVGYVVLSGLLGLITAELTGGMPERFAKVTELGAGGIALLLAVVPMPVLSFLQPVWGLCGVLVVVTSGAYTVIAAASGNRSALLYAGLAGVPGAILFPADLVFPGHGFGMLGLGVYVGGTILSDRMAETSRSRRDEQLLQATPDPVIAVDRHGSITAGNAAAREFMATFDHPEQLLPQVPVREQALVQAHLWRAVGLEDQAEFHLLREGEEVPFESLATPVGDGLAVLVLRDITRRKRMDAGLLHAARMETVAVLVGGIAHDFNNMLGTLLAHVGFLREVVEDDRFDARLAKMETTVERASLLTRRLLTVARGTQANLVRTDLLEVILGAVELVQPTLPSEIVLKVDIAEPLSPVLGSASDLEHVLVNLLVNARDAVESAGTIRLVARDFAVPSGARGSFVMVEDDGDGVPASLIDEIFNPFFTTKGPRQGTGLGLAVARQVLHDHHGRIWYEQSPTGGARFCLALHQEGAAEESPAPLPEHRRVLIAEDEPVLLDSFAGALREAGYEVTSATSGTEALTLLLREAPDILVTDVVMPGMSGIEVAQRCREIYPEVPVLLVSGYIPDDLAEHSGWSRLDKPVRASRLVATVGSLRRASERASRGEEDITAVRWAFPDLAHITAAELLGERR